MDRGDTPASMSWARLTTPCWRSARIRIIESGPLDCRKPSRGSTMEISAAFSTQEEVNPAQNLGANFFAAFSPYPVAKAARITKLVKKRRTCITGEAGGGLWAGPCRTGIGPAATNPPCIHQTAVEVPAATDTPWGLQPPGKGATGADWVRRGGEGPRLRWEAGAPQGRSRLSLKKAAKSRWTRGERRFRRCWSAAFRRASAVVG